MQPHSFSSSSSYYDSEEVCKPAASARPLKKAVAVAVAVAPLPPTPPRVYKVDPINFRDVVQKLTAPPEFQDRRLQAMPAPRPTVSNSQPRSACRRDFPGEGSLSYFNGYSGVEFSEKYY